MIDQFHELLQGLGQQLGVALHPDKRGACKLNIRNQFQIQIEYEPSYERILMASFICDIPPGKLRENILRDALKANYPFPQLGTLSYCERNNKLTLFLYLSLHGLNPDKLAVLLTHFIEKAKAWKEAAETGQSVSLPSSAQGAKSFGLL